MSPMVPARALWAGTAGDGSGASGFEFKITRRGLRVTVRSVAAPAGFRAVEWGDGTRQEGDPVASVFTHVYRRAGSYTVCVEGPGRDRSCQTVTVRPAGSRRQQP